MSPISAKTPNELLSTLDRMGIANTTTEHEAVMTVEQNQALRGMIPGLHSKNLFLKDKKGQLWLVVAEEDRPIDLKSLRKRIGAASLSFGKADLLRHVLGVEPGSVTPFAVINDSDIHVRVVLDRALADGERVNFHPLINTRSTTVSGSGLVEFLCRVGHDPLIIDFDSETMPS